MRNVRLWLALAAVFVGSFAVLGYYGLEIYREAPPIPGRVVTPGGGVVLTAQEVRDGQNVWQSIGGQEVGSVWGHGAYVAPDWSADWLHRESLYLLNLWAEGQYHQPYAKLGEGPRAELQAKLKHEIRTNTYDPATGDLHVSDDRAKAIDAMTRYYAAILGDATAFDADLAPIADGGRTPAQLREAYAIPANTLKDPQRKREFGAFIFWAAWSCGTERPATSSAATADGTPGITYTNNWPAEPLIGNTPGSAIVLWSVVSVVLLILGIAGLAWHHAAQSSGEVETVTPLENPLKGLQLTPSMRATLKYFWIVAALFVAQVGLGGLTAHYGVEGGSFFGIPLAQWLPYSVTRTWHTQIGIFWIATAWLATGLFVAPAISGVEPKFQRAGVNFLFVCLLLIVAGSMFGTWYATRQRMGFEMNFWFGHQGYEYVDLGRFWQWFLFVGLFVWLGLMTRAMWPAVKKAGEHKDLLLLFLISSAAIAAFYGAGLMWGRQTNLAVAEYWRWWVVHLWVEGFFEVFATVVIAFLFTRLGLLRVVTATSAVLFSTVIFLFGGIIGTMHHLYFSGTPTAVLGLGAVFSAMEVVPLTLVGFEAVENLRLSRTRRWVSEFKWPIYFFVAVAFWNMLGAGVFGFLINPPISLYYIQGLNTTAVHAHTALFGVYGMLGIGLMLFCLRAATQRRNWRTGTLKLSFWMMNAGLILMVVLSLLPIGLLQAEASIDRGLWYARSAEFLQHEGLQVLRWMRMVGDTCFAIGVMTLAWFILGLATGRSYTGPANPAPLPPRHARPRPEPEPELLEVH